MDFYPPTGTDSSGSPPARTTRCWRTGRQRRVGGAAGQACHDDGVAVAVFPELTLSGYSIEDILLQDTLLDAVEDALLDVVAASADLLPVLVVGAPRYLHRITTPRW